MRLTSSNAVTAGRRFSFLSKDRTCDGFGDGRSIAAQLVLTGNHNISETVSACADSQYLKTGANAYLRWKTFEQLAAWGFTHNDLTDASLNSVTRFKSQFGGDLRLCMACVRPKKLAYRFGTGLEDLVRSSLQRMRFGRSNATG